MLSVELPARKLQMNADKVNNQEIEKMVAHAQNIGPDEETRLEMHIRSLLSGRVRGLRVLRRDDGFVLRGRTPTYYDKQLVLHAAMQVTALPILADEIDVVYAQEKQYTDSDNEP